MEEPDDGLDVVVGSAELLLQAAIGHVRELRELQRLRSSPRCCADGAMGVALSTGGATVRRGSSFCDAGEAARPFAVRERWDGAQDAADPALEICDADGPEMLDIWCGEEDLHHSVNVAISSRPELAPSSVHFGDVASDTDCWSAGRCIGCLPTARARFTWDILSLLSLGWDLIVLPLSAFQVDEVGFVIAAGWVTTTFWALDIGVSFISAYHRPDGLIETRLKKIAGRYISTWFCFDLTLVLVDIFARLWFVGGGVLGRVGKLWRFARVMKALRMLRMVRAMKFVVLFDTLADAMLSKPIATGMTILRLLVEVAIAAHFIACGWYFIGFTHGAEAGWVRPYLDESRGYHYLLAFHWTIAQFTPAPTDIHARTFEERLFCTLVLFIGIIVFSSLIGRVTALVTKRNQEATNELLDSERLRVLCEDREISLPLANRLIRFVRHPNSREKWVVEHDITSLNRMPTDLLVEFRYGVYSSVLASHPLFPVLRDTWRAVILEICHSAVQESRTGVGETVFRSFTRGAGIYFIVRGNFTYLPGELFLQVADLAGGQSNSLSVGKWLSEASLWTQWEHKGLLASRTSGSVAVVHTDAFRIAVGAHKPSMQLVKRYAGHYVQRMRAASEVTDLWNAFDGEDVADVLLEAPPKSAHKAPPKAPALVAEPHATLVDADEEDGLRAV